MTGLTPTEKRVGDQSDSTQDAWANNQIENRGEKVEKPSGKVIQKQIRQT